MELRPGVRRVERVSGAACFLVVTDEGSALVDTGLPGNEGKIVEYMERAGVDPDGLGQIVLTHSDIDHSGSAAGLKELTGARVAIHEADAAKLAGEQKLKDAKGAMGLLLRVMGPAMRFNPVTPDLTLKDGDKVLDLTVVHTPGHTEGSVCLLRDGQALFVGDALRTDSKGWPRLPPQSLSVDMDRARASIERIAGLGYDSLYPGHGAPIAANASSAVAAFVKNGFK